MVGQNLTNGRKQCSVRGVGGGLVRGLHKIGRVRNPLPIMCLAPEMSLSGGGVYISFYANCITK